MSRRNKGRREKPKESPMLKKLQHKFVGIAIIALVTIVFVELFSVNLVNIYQHDSDSRNLLYLIAENDGVLPGGNIASGAFNAFWNPFGKPKITAETEYSTHYFVVKLHHNVVTDISLRNIANVSDQDAFEIASQVFEREPGFGFIDFYRYYYVSDSLTGNAIMVFLDFEKELVDTLTLASISFLMGVICIAVLTFPVYLLSKNALRPVKNSIEKQKQFITDAGHELKTPLAVISADVDVLELCNGENEWLSSIRSQTQRMNVLVRNLVELSKLDEARAEEMREFNISEAVLDTALSFEPIAKSRALRFEVQAEPDLKYKGNEGEIRQLVSILCDNAVKYAAPQGIISLSLYKSGKNICLDAYNDCEELDKTKMPHFFDRFYRADTSRARETGGYGIGLSIAKAIVDRHKGKITVSAPNDRAVLFRAVL